MFRTRCSGRDIIHRWEGNPLICLADLDFACSDIRAAGVTLVDKEIVLLITIEHLKGHQSLHIARREERGSFHIDKEPLISTEHASFNSRNRHEMWGVMDARITQIDGIYHIMYVARGEHGVRLGLAITKDFIQIEHRGFISEPDTKGGALFSEKINGRYARLERPRQGGSIWISYSDDLIYWGGSTLLMSPRTGFWDSARIGTAAPPIRIPQGWLFIYYGIKQTSAGPLFRLGAAILDGENPDKMIDRTNIPILSPREDYERVGDLSNVVFCTGAIIENDTELRLFYSGADSCLCLGSTTIDEVVNACSKSREDY